MELNQGVGDPSAGTSNTTIADGVSASIKATVFDYLNSNPLAVRLTDTGGDYVAAGAGTQYTSGGVVPATPIGTATVFDDGGTWATVSDTNGLPVQIIGTVPISGTITVNQGTSPWVVSLTSTTITGTVAVTQSTSPWVVSGTVAFSNTTIAVTNAGTFAVQLTGATNNINNISGTISLPTGAATAANQQTDALTDTELRATPVPVSGTVAFSNTTIAVTNAGTFVVQENGAALTSLQLIDDAIYTDGAGTVVKGIAILGQDGTNPQAIHTDSSGDLQVDVLTMPTVTVTGSVTVSGTVAATQSGVWNITDISGTVSLPTGASTAALQTTGNTSLATIAGAVSGTEMQVDVLTMPTVTVTATNLDIRDLTSASDSVLIYGSDDGGTTKRVIKTDASGSIQVDVESIGTVTVTGTVAATQSGTWNITNISGTISLPTGAATEATLATRLADATFTTVLGSASLILATQADDVANTSDGLQTTSFGYMFDGATWDRVRGTSADGLLVNLGANNDVTVTGTVAVTQSGTWNITNISGTISLPTGAATLAEQQTQTASLSVLDDWDETNRAAVNLIASQVGVQGGSGAVSANTQRVVLATDVALPAGTNAIGTVTIAKSGTATLSNVASSATSVTLLSAAATRLGATFVNDSTQICYVKFGTTASATDYSVRMYPNDYFELPFNYTGRIDAIWASANGNMRVTELT